MPCVIYSNQVDVYVLFSITFISTSLILYRPRISYRSQRAPHLLPFIKNANLYDFELTEDDIQKLDALDCGKAGDIS